MILKGRISFDKRNLPPYIYRFNVAMVVFFAASLAVLLAAGVAIGLTLGDDAEMYFVLSFLAVFLAATLAFIIIGLRLRERLINERTAELEKQFADMPLEEATAELIRQGIITENGFVCDKDGVFGKETVPFEKLNYGVYGQIFIKSGHRFVQYWTRPSNPDVFLSVRTDDSGIAEFQNEYPLDGALFNFIDKRGLITDYEKNKDFALLKSDKKNFCRMALGFKPK